MSTAEVFPAPTVTPPSEGGDPKWVREYEAFHQKLPELMKDYKGKFVAIHDGNVVAAGPNEIDVLEAAYERVGYVALHVGKVSQEPEPVYHFRSPRVPQNYE